jgi:hypothetical protein
MIVLKLDVTKLLKEKFHRGEKGIYCDLVLIERPDNYGNDGFVAQSVSKEERDAGERGPIVGSWREVAKKGNNAKANAAAAAAQKRIQAEDDDLPF